jgi:S-adenosyl-L-methionine hydrolase (adenosine-forming)
VSGASRDQARVPLILFFTDFGSDGPYVGQMRLAVGKVAPMTAVVHLMHDAPRFDPKSSAYLLAALAPRLPPRSTCVGVVDPGVGGERAGVIVKADGRFFVGPGNGLFEILRRRAKEARIWTLKDQPDAAPSFHGRDIFAPAAAHLSLGAGPEGLGARAASATDFPGADWPDDLSAIIYCDHYGNAMTGLRAVVVPQTATLRVTGKNGPVDCKFARTFSAVPRGAAFWYENSNGLAEIAVNGGSACDDLGLAPGLRVEIR